MLCKVYHCILKGDIEETHDNISKGIEENPAGSHQSEQSSENNAIESVDKEENPEQVKGQSSVENYMESGNDKSPTSSNFISYFVVMAILTVCVYLIFYNKKKVR